MIPPPYRPPVARMIGVRAVGLRRGTTSGTTTPVARPSSTSPRSTVMSEQRSARHARDRATQSVVQPYAWHAWRKGGDLEDAAATQVAARSRQTPRRGDPAPALPESRRARTVQHRLELRSHPLRTSARSNKSRQAQPACASNLLVFSDSGKSKVAAVPGNPAGQVLGAQPGVEVAPAGWPGDQTWRRAGAGRRLRSSPAQLPPMAAPSAVGSRKLAAEQR